MESKLRSNMENAEVFGVGYFPFTPPVLACSRNNVIPHTKFLNLYVCISHQQ